MIYVEGEGFKLTDGDSWKRDMIVLQCVNPQGAWIDKVTAEMNREFRDDDLEEFYSNYVVDNKPYRILRRESKETLIKTER